MKIGFIDFVLDRNLPVGTSGLSEVVWCLAAPLAELGHEVHVAGPYNTDVVPSRAVHVHRFELPPIGYRNIVGHALIVKRAIETLRRYGPFDVVHAPDYLSTALHTWLNPATPVVLTEPGNIYERIANGNPYDRVTTQVYKWAARTTGRRAARIVATSDEMAVWWNRCGASYARIVRIPLGVDLKDFVPVADARAHLGWNPEQQHILFVARLSPETGAAYLLGALPRIHDQFPAAHVHIVGSGPSEQQLRHIARDLKIEPSMTWHGWLQLSELPRVYAAADVMVFPGTSGGTPRVMLQAMACETPVVGSAIGGITDHIEHERTGLLVPARDEHALTEAVCRVLHDPTAAHTRAARARAYVATLGWPTIAARVHREVYQPLVAERTAQAAFAESR